MSQPPQEPPTHAGTRESDPTPGKECPSVEQDGNLGSDEDLQVRCD
jgi:hypothetical protein